MLCRRLSEPGRNQIDAVIVGLVPVWFWHIVLYCQGTLVLRPIHFSPIVYHGIDPLQSRYIMVSGLWPHAWLTPGQCLYLLWPYIYPTKLTICVALKWQYVWPMSVLCKAYIPGWLDAGLKYLQCISNGDAAVLHQAIDIPHELWTDAWLAPGQCLYLWLPYIYPKKLTICVALK